MSVMFITKAGQVLGLVKFAHPKKFCKMMVRSYSVCEPQTNIKNHPIVTVQQGQLKGAVGNLIDGSTYYSFKGVPYAQPPIGNLRFKAPLPPQPWDGIYEATEHGAVCPQMDMMSPKNIEAGDENCLFLNVFTKSLSINPTNLPVMVYFHGGAFMTGSGNSGMYGPDYLLQHDVILVTLNYRLEALGFLCLDTPEAPGNAGLKDQVAALRWVKNNIAQFGGDPNNVTIFGESAGGSCVGYHMMSPMSTGLFSKAIMQSGTCIDDWANQTDTKGRAARIAKFFGKEFKTDDELVNFLRGLPAVELAGLTLKTRTDDEKHRGLPIYYTPVVEKKYEGVESFLNEEPLDILLGGKMSQVPIIMGYNSAEGLLMLSDQIKKLEFKNKNLHYYVPREIALKVTFDKQKEFGDRIKQFFIGNTEFSLDTAAALVEIQTDIHFTYNSHRFLHYYSALSQAYAYRFNFTTELNVVRNIQEYSSLYNGACHADDLFYFFSNKGCLEDYQTQDKLKDIVWKVTKLWTNFAKTGNPTPDNELGVKWEPYNNNKNFFHLEEPLTNGECKEKKRVSFWNKLYSEAGLPHIPKSNI